MFHDTKSFRAENEVPRKKVPEDKLSKGNPQDSKDNYRCYRKPTDRCIGHGNGPRRWGFAVHDIGHREPGSFFDPVHPCHLYPCLMECR